MSAVDWIAVDWGTSALRAYAMTGGQVVETRSASKGMGGLKPDEFEPALLDLIGDWLDGPTEVLACGMVGARQGWVEAPYHPVPCRPVGAGAITAPTHDPRLKMRILPGLSQASPPDVMRGEETQIAGFLALNPGWDGVLCLPGTHTKWVHLSAGEVVSFRTVMTGEVFALLSTASVLRHSMGEGAADEAAFDSGVDDIISRPEGLTAQLFAIRAGDLLTGQAPGAARGRLSGLLIGAELAATRPYWLGQQVGIVGDGEIARLYARALQNQGVPASLTRGEAATIAGLTAARRALEGET